MQRVGGVRGGSWRAAARALEGVRYLRPTLRPTRAIYSSLEAATATPTRRGKFVSARA